MLFVKNVKFISFLCTNLFSKNYNFKVIILFCLLFLGVNFCFGVLHFLCLAKKKNSNPFNHIDHLSHGTGNFLFIYSDFLADTTHYSTFYVVYQ